MSYQSIYEAWLADPRLAESDRAELKAIAGDEKEKEYRFGGELAFGTAGMRGILGCGMNMMNVYTVMRATQGLSEYIKTLPAAEQAKGVVISYDTRRNSRLFAEKAAGVPEQGGGGLPVGDTGVQQDQQVGAGGELVHPGLHQRGGEKDEKGALRRPAGHERLPGVLPLR